ncbi:hypothetical protein P170DRAFT_514483 [Aspergillus steynii IBT 23096]|uniref:Uncharacterized protein n=1 Tax=Aspergillus steynii IBT 23096 TaxID=1392250 RepID=A0A2I2FRE8_9EURO|nr:uncharacterized protein P170DRAFT_514483 [Aspergillus steynii IBT 23096]PLB43214.1 hypothetical protein P170DRAFT_514483 [Aspergillus steynii IBT 23096]
MSEEERIGVVLLVTAPIGSSFRNIVRAVGREPPSSPPVAWESRENRALPNIESRLKFMTHYALCVIPSEIWDHPSLTLLTKFAHAKFWDHPGDSTSSTASRSSRSGSIIERNADRTWEKPYIRAIESGQEIGRTNMFYRGLRRDWRYMPVYWNCHDLAIRLAYLIVPASNDVMGFLRELMRGLMEAYFRERALVWQSTKVALGIWTTGALRTLDATPSLTAVDTVLFMAELGVGYYVSEATMAKLRTKEMYMRKLEEQFPKLKPLHFHWRRWSF